MLVKSMTNEEIHYEVIRDFDLIITSSTRNRLKEEYLLLRKKLKINKKIDHPIIKTIKTNAKNNWFIIIRKHPDSKTVNSSIDIADYFYTYYYTDMGIRIFNVIRNGVLLIYNGHLFSRYRERMKIPIDNTLDLIKYFFVNNQGGMQKMFPKEKNAKIYFMTFANDGYLMGNYEIINKNKLWIIHKTFIAKSTATDKHLQGHKELMFTIAKLLSEYQNDNQKVLDSKINVLAHELGLMKDDKIIADLNTIIKEMPKELIDDLNEEMLFI